LEPVDLLKPPLGVELALVLDTKPVWVVVEVVLYVALSV
jgi:hypothetical protein